MMNADDTWRKFNSFQQKIESKFIPRVLAPIKRVINEFIKAGMPVSKIDTMISLTPDLIPVLNNLYYQCGYGYGWSVYKSLPKAKAAAFDIQTKDSSKDVTPEDIAQEVLNELRFSLLVNVHGIEQTIKDRILYLIQQGAINGYGFEKTAQMVSEVASIVRARRIVRTESVKAANLAGLRGAQRTGLAMDKEWINARDLRVRGNPVGKYPNAEFDHWDANGQRVPMDAAFTIGGEKLLYPGDPHGSEADIINCRCTAAFIPKRDANGRPIRIRPGFFQMQNV